MSLEGCGKNGQTTWFGKQESKPEEAETATLDEPKPEESAAVRDTIASNAWIEGMRKMAVGGYALVVGLGKNGTMQCPRPIREYMLQDMRRRYRLGGASEGLEHLSPENLVDSEETAIVVVSGEIPAAASKGTGFDLTVRALEGTDVRSLEGGWLMPCDLKLWADDKPVEGRVLGTGMGQVFTNPFGLKEDAATKTNPRIGHVLGGGTATKDRRLRLVLTDPSAAMASRLMQLINRRFGVEPYKTADAMNPHAIDLRIPKAWIGSEPHFLNLLMHLYVPSTPSFFDMRLRELCEEAVQAEARLADISLAWEGLGKTSMPAIRKLYTHEKPDVSYFAARAGLRMNDDLAINVMARHVNDPESAFREVAIEELGRAVNLTRCVMVLRPLLEVNDQQIRQLAYKALLRQQDPTIQSFLVGDKGGFAVDVIPSRSGYLVSARRSESQRIALFGVGLRCQTPVFYTHRSDDLIITATIGDKHLKLVRRAPLTRRLSPPIYCNTDVASLIKSLGNPPTKNAEGNYKGLGLTYSQIVEVLNDLCADKTIQATFMLQGKETAEINAEPKGIGRPESEL